MNLDANFRRLPLSFESDLLRRELIQLGEELWQPHPLGYAGVEQLPLITDRKTEGNGLASMRATAALKKCPYVCQLLAALGSVIGRTHLLRYNSQLGAGSEPWVDLAYYWQNHVRIHVPVITGGEVFFRCGEERVRMATGEAWVLNSWKPHGFDARGEISPVHLVVGASGSSYLWNMGVYSSQSDPHNGPESPQMVWHTGEQRSFDMERYAALAIRTPEQLDVTLSGLLRDVQTDPAANQATLARLELVLGMLRRDWRNAWLIHGRRPEGDERYRFLMQYTLIKLREQCGELRLPSNGVPVVGVLEFWFKEALKDRVRRAA